MTPLEWAIGCAYFSGIAVAFYLAALAADLIEKWFPERKDND